MLSRDPIRVKTQVGLSIPMTTEIGQVSNRPQAVQNMLFWNLENRTFSEGASMAGVAASEWSWSGLFQDVDLDGYEDILVTTGNLFDVQDADAQQEEIERSFGARTLSQFQALILGFPPIDAQQHRL